MNSKIRNLIMSATALMLCCCILAVTNLSLSSRPAQDTESEEVDVSSVSASSGSSSGTAGKEEVIYISMDAAGNATAVNVVNIFTGGGDITDYGSYTSVKMMTTNDEITQNGDEITFSTDSERVYYQGTMDSGTALPWTITIKYYMDGTQYSASEIAGMSGSLLIEISVEENTAYDGEYDFCANYLLQAALTLDTDSASNITAEGATAANVGSDKQLSYMVLPGEGLEAEITADVTDFEMPAIEINGVPLSLALDIDDEELEDTVNELMDALEELESGAAEIDDGAGELSDGAGELSSGTASLEDGSASLDDGLAELYSGMQTLQSGLDTLNGNSSELTDGSEQILAALETIETALEGVSTSTAELSELSAASGSIQDGIDSLYSGILSLQTNLSYSSYKLVMAANGLDIDELVAGNTEAIAAITELLPLLSAARTVLSNETVAAYVAALGIDIDVDELETLANTLITLLTGNNAAISGMEAYLDSVSAGTDELAAGAAALASSYAEFNSAIESLTQSLTSMLSQMTELKSGVSTLVSSYKALDSGIEEYTEGVAEVVAGYTQLVNGMSALSSGSSELLSGVGELADGTAELYSGTLELTDGTAEMADGTTELYDEISDAKDELEEELGDLIEAITGDSEVCSFVSAKNTSVEAVQFVITTEAIETEEIETEETEEEESSGFWQKLKALFS